MSRVDRVEKTMPGCMAASICWIGRCDGGVNVEADGRDGLERQEEGIRGGVAIGRHGAGKAQPLGNCASDRDRRRRQSGTSGLPPA